MHGINFQFNELPPQSLCNVVPAFIAKLYSIIKQLIIDKQTNKKVKRGQKFLQSQNNCRAKQSIHPLIKFQLIFTTQSRIGKNKRTKVGRGARIERRHDKFPRDKIFAINVILSKIPVPWQKGREPVPGTTTTPICLH